MFRHAVIPAVNNYCGSLRATCARNSLCKGKPQVTASTFNYFQFVRCKSTGGGNGAGVGLNEASMQVSETIVDSATDLNEPLNIIPLTPEISAQLVEKVAASIASNGEPTLASMGLGSWWPSGIVQQCLEYLHCDLGLPWWGAIATGRISVSTVSMVCNYMLPVNCGNPPAAVFLCGTVVIHVLLFPLVIRSQREVAKIQNNMHQMQTLKLKMVEARETGNALMAAKYSNDLMVFMKEKDINPIKLMLIPLAQAPIFLSVLFGLEGMANVPVESMKTGGMLWFTDLTIADPIFLLPVITGTVCFVTLQIKLLDNRKPATKTNGDHIMKYASYAIPFIFAAASMNFPAALHCHWFTTTIVSLGQVLLFRVSSSSVKRRLGIPELVKHDQKKAPLPNNGFILSYEEAWIYIKIIFKMGYRERYAEAFSKRAGRLGSEKPKRSH